MQELIEAILNGTVSREEFEILKKKYAKKHKCKIPSNPEIYAASNFDERVRVFLKKKPRRTLSGVAVVAVMTRPWPCPHGKCIYCPGTGTTPQSYTGHEPAAMRGQQHSYDSKKQVLDRLSQLESMGHKPQKIDVIVMGGTFTSQPFSYQTSFIKGIYDGLNGFDSKDLESAIKANETANKRCVGLTIETRPDEINEDTIKKLLNFGTTRLELGVQNPDDEIYSIVNRGHTVKDVIKATQLAKDSLFKICYHLMPGLPGSDYHKDLNMFRKIFEDDNFKPDMIKIYPTLLLKGFGQEKLRELYEKGQWKPYSEEELINFLMDVTSFIPRWVRIMRVERDIPSKLILAGPIHTNIREIYEKKLLEKGLRCNCIRCREILIENYETFSLKATEYDASGGKEIFLEFITPSDRLLGFLRLRFLSNPFLPELQSSAGIRELHIYGEQVPLKEKGQVQHRKFGRMLVEKAEEIAKENGFKKICVISGVGVREYYSKLGFVKDGHYMSKKL
ncbi:MAG: tRNA uridine(34) 5-carboxymethylaminomethyl modification radical SAM/GNAT enzyme Elp3 [archaeon]